MKKNLYTQLLADTLAGKKSFAILIDPDKYSLDSLSAVVQLAVNAGVDYFFLAEVC